MAPGNGLLGEYSKQLACGPHGEEQDRSWGTMLWNAGMEVDVTFRPTHTKKFPELENKPSSGLPSLYGEGNGRRQHPSGSHRSVMRCVTDSQSLMNPRQGEY
jgi:hypothetical protein